MFTERYTMADRLLILGWDGADWEILDDLLARGVLPFVDKPNYGLAVWPGSGADKPRLAWATSPTGDPGVTQLFIATVDGSSVTPVLTESVAAGGAIRVVAGGLATSGTATRGAHLVDTTNGRPSESCWQQVTASGATCLGADVAAKAGFLLGEGGPQWLDSRGVPGR